MNVKTDTKEKFIVLTPESDRITANMTEDIRALAQYATPELPHLVINMKNVREIAPEAAQTLAGLQQEFYERDHSFVICELQVNVEETFGKEDLLDALNFTPTESEAWDILQMEEIERELMGDFDEESDG